MAIGALGKRGIKKRKRVEIERDSRQNAQVICDAKPSLNERDGVAQHLPDVGDGVVLLDRALDFFTIVKFGHSCLEGKNSQLGTKRRDGEYSAVHESVKRRGIRPNVTLLYRGRTGPRARDATPTLALRAHPELKAVGRNWLS